MADYRFGNRLDGLLRAVANSKHLIDNDEDRAQLREAADVLARLKQPVEVVIVGPSSEVDPVIGDVLDYLESWRRLYDTLAILEDQGADIARHLHKLTAREAT